MYVDASTVRRGNKTYTRYLLRESFREAGKVKHRTIANLSQCSACEIEAIRLALTHKHTLADLGSVQEAVQLRQGASVGAVALLYGLAQQIGLTQALGPGREASLALWQVIARVIDQGSRLSAVRLARHHCAQELLGLARFDEDDLYANLDWLCENQPGIEQRLFAQHCGQDHGGLFLYDVTSSYLEGEHNELAAFGYNRDGKRGKRQIVIGLLCDGQGRPLCIAVFEANTQDPKTFVPQVKKVAARFGAQEVTFVGDRGMIKSAQIEAWVSAGFTTSPPSPSRRSSGCSNRGRFRSACLTMPWPRCRSIAACAMCCAVMGSAPRRWPIRAKTSIGYWHKPYGCKMRIWPSTSAPSPRWRCASCKRVRASSA
jgi:hypothetical protein